MPTTRDTTAEQPGKDADALFAAWLADIAAHVDDPEYGQTMREILEEDPAQQREDFYFQQMLLSIGPPVPPLPIMFAPVLAALFAVAFLLVRWLL